MESPRTFPNFPFKGTGIGLGKDHCGSADSEAFEVQRTSESCPCKIIQLRSAVSLFELSKYFQLGPGTMDITSIQDSARESVTESHSCLM